MYRKSKYSKKYPRSNMKLKKVKIYEITSIKNIIFLKHILFYFKWNDIKKVRFWKKINVVL